MSSVQERVRMLQHAESTSATDTSRIAAGAVAKAARAFSREDDSSYSREILHARHQPSPVLVARASPFEGTAPARNSDVSTADRGNRNSLRARAALFERDNQTSATSQSKIQFAHAASDGSDLHQNSSAQEKLHDDRRGPPVRKFASEGADVSKVDPDISRQGLDENQFLAHRRISDATSDDSMSSVRNRASLFEARPNNSSTNDAITTLPRDYSSNSEKDGSSGELFLDEKVRGRRTSDADRPPPFSTLKPSSSPQNIVSSKLNQLSNSTARPAGLPPSTGTSFPPATGTAESSYLASQSPGNNPVNWLETFPTPPASSPNGIHMPPSVEVSPLIVKKPGLAARSAMFENVDVAESPTFPPIELPSVGPSPARPARRYFSSPPQLPESPPALPESPPGLSDIAQSRTISSPELEDCGLPMQRDASMEIVKNYTPDDQGVRLPTSRPISPTPDITRTKWVARETSDVDTTAANSDSSASRLWAITSQRAPLNHVVEASPSLKTRTAIFEKQCSIDVSDTTVVSSFDIDQSSASKPNALLDTQVGAKSVNQESKENYPKSFSERASLFQKTDTDDASRHNQPSSIQNSPFLSREAKMRSLSSEKIGDGPTSFHSAEKNLNLAPDARLQNRFSKISERAAGFETAAKADASSNLSNMSGKDRLDRESSSSDSHLPSTDEDASQTSLTRVQDRTVLFEVSETSTDDFKSFALRKGASDEAETRDGNRFERGAFRNREQSQPSSLKERTSVFERKESSSSNLRNLSVRENAEDVNPRPAVVSSTGKNGTSEVAVSSDCKNESVQRMVNEPRLLSIPSSNPDFEKRSSIFERCDSAGGGRKAPVDGSFNGAAIAYQASKFEEARREVRDSDKLNQNENSGVASRLAIFEPPSKEVVTENKVTSAFAARASLFELKEEKSEVDLDRENAQQVFLAMRGAARSGDGGPTVHETSSRADARKIAVPDTSALVQVSDIGSIMRMNAELVSTLTRLMTACASIEKDKEALSKRIQDLEAKVARSRRR